MPSDARIHTLLEEIWQSIKADLRLLQVISLTPPCSPTTPSPRCTSSCSTVFPAPSTARSFGTLFYEFTLEVKKKDILTSTVSAPGKAAVTVLPRRGSGTTRMARS